MPSSIAVSLTRSRMRLPLSAPPTLSGRPWSRPTMSKFTIATVRSSGTGRREGPREAEDYGRARRVVIGARVDDAVGEPEVIVVRADDDGFGGERRVRPGQDADDVRCPDLVEDLLDAQVRARPRLERGGATRGGQGPRRVGKRAPGRRQYEVGGLPREGARQQRDLDGRLVRRRQLAGRDQEREGAVPLGCDQPVEAGHANVGQVRRGALERERDLSANVDGGIVVVAGLGHPRAVPDEDDFTGDLAGARASVRRPFAPSVEPAHGGAEQVEAAGRPWTRGRLEDERLEERSLVASGSKTRGGQPVGDLLGGVVAPRRTRPATLHLGRGQGLHAVDERSGLRRHDRGPRRGAGGDDDQGGRKEKCDETTDHTGILLY